MSGSTVQIQHAGLPVAVGNPFPVVQTGTPALATGAATAAKQPALGTAGTPSADVISVQGKAYTGTFTVTRANNTTAYTAGDVVGAAFAIANLGPTGGGDVLLTKLKILLNITALPAGMTTFKIPLYNVTPPSAIADNSPWTLASGDRASYIGMIEGVIASARGTGTQSVEAVLKFSPAEQYTIPSTGLYGYLVTDAAFTPAAVSETYTGEVKALAA